MSRYYEIGGSFVELMDGPRVYMHDINTLPGFERIIPQVDGIEKYDRVTAIARRCDVALLKAQPESEYLDWLSGLGLGTDKILVLEGKSAEPLPLRVLEYDVREEVEALLGKGLGKAVLSPYYGGRFEGEASRYLGIPMYTRTRLVERYDSKINFKAMCREVGVPVVEDSTFCAVEGPRKLAQLVDDFLPKTGKAVVRGEFGASASTTHIFDRAEVSDMENLLEDSDPIDRFVVEPYHTKTSSPSSVWFVKRDGTPVHLKTSDQLLNGGVSHAGNYYPVPFDEGAVMEMALRVAFRLVDEGFIGPFGLDFMSTREGIYATECNPRVTGAMYPWEVVRIMEAGHGETPAALSRNIHMPRKGMRFKDLQEIWNGSVYDGAGLRGKVFPFNVGPIAEGKVTAVAAGATTEELLDLFSELERRLEESG
jgi:hypothetical protein